MRAAEPLTCPLCGAERVHPLGEVHARRFFECAVCRLAFVHPGQRLDAAAERRHYGTHHNDPADPGYRAFLDRLAAPLVERLAPGAEGLDYGSGPGPALAAMLRERGFRVEVFDPFFAPDPAPLRRSYDFVTCTETAEHFFHPGDELRRLDGLLRPGGWLGIMTEMLREGRVLERWRYARDPTHVCFFRPETMEWIAGRFGWTLHSPREDVALFRKAAARRADPPPSESEPRAP